MPSPVTVIRDGGIRATGYRDGEALVYDWGFTWHGVDQEQRSFVLLDTGFQINQPVIFPEQQRGWWYCDLVTVVDDGDTVHVDDHWIDVIVGPPDHPYRVLDLDEYADAIAAGDIDAATGIDGLRRSRCSSTGTSIAGTTSDVTGGPTSHPAPSPRWPPCRSPSSGNSSTSTSEIPQQAAACRWQPLHRSCQVATADPLAE